MKSQRLFCGQNLVSNVISKLSGIHLYSIIKIYVVCFYFGTPIPNSSSVFEFLSQMAV